MHNGRLIDPLDTIAKQIKVVSSKTRKTDDDHEEMARLEWLGGIYFQPQAGPFIPAMNVQKAIIEGARLSRDGKKIERGVLFDEMVIPLQYDGAREPLELFEDKRFVSRMPVKVGQARVMRTRPIFPEWRLTAAGRFDGAVLDLADLRRAATTAGAMIGLGDSPPTAGSPPTCRTAASITSTDHTHPPTPATAARRRPGRKRGVPPRWEILYAAMAALDVGEMITYERIGRLLHLDHTDLRDRQAIAVCSRRAGEALAIRDKKIAVLVRGQGYQIAAPDTIMAVARRHQARAFDEVAAGQAMVGTIDLSTLDATTARVVAATAMGFARQAAFMRHLDVRQDRLDVALSALAVTVDNTVTRVEETSTGLADTRAELARLREQVTRLESRLPGTGNTPTS